jgi:hypothetical protein
MPLEQLHSKQEGRNPPSIDDATKTSRESFSTGTYESFLARTLVQEATESFDYLKLVRKQR